MQEQIKDEQAFADHHKDLVGQTFEINIHGTIKVYEIMRVYVAKEGGVYIEIKPFNEPEETYSLSEFLSWINWKF